MTYLLMIYLDEAGWPKLTKAEQDQGTAAYQAYFEALEKEGAFKGANRLQPSTTATTVHVANGKRVVTDGPYAETKEQLGGYFLIDAPDLDSAVAWAARCPAPATDLSRCGRSGKCRCKKVGTIACGEGDSQTDPETATDAGIRERKHPVALQAGAVKP